MQSTSSEILGGHETYSVSLRTDILPLVDRKYSQVLDVGCSTGNTGVMLKDHGLCDYVTGIELFEETAKVAKTRLDVVIVGSVESALDKVQDQSMDCILCLDVLEHLVDPWSVIKRLGTKVKSDGIIICSIPNIRHVSVLFNLIVRGQWRYTDSGMLDRTHLRFFTKDSCYQLANLEGFAVEEIHGHIGPKSRALNYLSLGIFRNFLFGQYLTRSRKSPNKVFGSSNEDG
jgi:2-polyprenyl-3-methyl-5-hydroxy-6-metoxy-1,4-benzoquinol methylase